MAALKRGKQCYLASPSGNKAAGVLTAIQERLLDFDDRARTQALVVACDIMKYVPPNLISEANERLRDKKIRRNLRLKYMKLTEVYQDYCDKCSQGYMTITDHFEQISDKILLLSSDKDSEEFRSQNMEFVLSYDLFPRLLPVQCFAVEPYSLHVTQFSFISEKKVSKCKLLLVAVTLASQRTICTKHHLFEFLLVLSTKCSPTIFCSEHVQYLLNELCSSSSVNMQLKAPSIKLLLH